MGSSLSTSTLHAFPGYPAGALAEHESVPGGMASGSIHCCFELGSGVGRGCCAQIAPAISKRIPGATTKGLDNKEK